MSSVAAREGFTLIEVLAVLFLTSLVLGVALNFYVDLSNQSHYASESTREIRRATTLLDRLAQDFEQAMLVRKPAEMDPLAHPWVFLAERRNAGGGADRVKFIARRTPDRRSTEQVSDLAMVSYALRPGSYGEGFDLVRWSSPDLPEDLDRDFPPADDPGAQLLADGVSHFSLRFLDDEGEWVEEWDSSQLLDSSELPAAVEIEVALASTDPRTGEEQASQTYRRRVLLPLRPLDLETLLDPVAYAAAGQASAAETQCELTVADCVDLSGMTPQADDGSQPDLSALLSLSPQEREVIRQLQGGGLGDVCWDVFREAYGDNPGVRSHCR